MKAIKVAATWLILCILLVACQIPTPQVPEATAIRPEAATLAPTPTNVSADRGWQALFAGAEVRSNLGNSGLLALRLDPAAVTFDVAFRAILSRCKRLAPG